MDQSEFSKNEDALYPPQRYQHCWEQMYTIWGSLLMMIGAIAGVVSLFFYVL
jgi:hypothetical protein